jgi:hypothetical protein
LAVNVSTLFPMPQLIWTPVSVPLVSLNVITKCDSRWRSSWSTALQTGKSRDRFPIVSLEFLIDIILAVTLWQACQTCGPRAACGSLQVHLRPAQRIL